MLKYNNKSNLLEQYIYHYSLQDVDEPNLYRELFPYTEAPKVAFNHRRVPYNMPADIWITDTTFRDGQQSRQPYTVEQIVTIFKLMSRLGGENGMIRQTEFFVYTKKDRDALEQCMALGLRFPETTTWIRATKEDFKLVKDIGIKETGILMSCSDYHIFKKLNLTRKQAMDKYLSIAKEALNAGLTPRCHLEDITRSDCYGFVIPLVTELTKLSHEANIPIKIRACDTMGYGIPYSGVALPRSVPGIIYGINHFGEVPSELIEWHGHNDFYKGVINASTAWMYGSSAVNCSLLGIGERTGNVPTEAMVFEYASIKGHLNGMDTTAITEIADYFRKDIGYDIPPMTPFVGQNFNVTRAGIHADGMLKDEEIYNIFDTTLILNNTSNVALSNTSGLAGIAHWVNSYFELKDDNKIDKKDQLVIQIKELIDAEYENGRVVMISDEEMISWINDIAPERFNKKK